MRTIRIETIPEEWESYDVDWIIFTFGKDVWIVKGDYVKSALNLAKALLDVGYTVRVRKEVYKEEKIGKNTKKSIGIEIDFAKIEEYKKSYTLWLTDNPIINDSIKTTKREMRFTNIRWTLKETLESFAKENNIPNKVSCNEEWNICSLFLWEEIVYTALTSGKNENLNKW